MLGKILVCLDGSSFSEQILPYVVGETKRSGSKVMLLRVVSIARIAASCSPTPHPVPPAILDALVQSSINSARAYLYQVASKLKDAGLDVDCVVLAGTVADEIVNYAKENEVDCIAMVTHERKRIGRLIFGSVTGTVIKESRLPVLLLRSRRTGANLFERVQFSDLRFLAKPKSAILTGKAANGV